MPQPPMTGPIRFGAFEVDPHSVVVRKHGVRIRLQDQPSVEPEQIERIEAGIPAASQDPPRRRTVTTSAWSRKSGRWVFSISCRII
jgi:hypothetical protein